jgi:hypothetical protein
LVIKSSAGLQAFRSGTEYEYSNLRYAFRTLIAPHVDMNQVKQVIAQSLFVPEADDVPLGP